METNQQRSPEWLKAATALLPLMLKIPREVIKRHNLRFDTMIENTMATQKELGDDIPLTDIFEIDMPYYIAYGMSKDQYNGGGDAVQDSDWELTNGLLP